MNSGFFATADGVKVIEFNARFGDPECMNIMSLFEGSWPAVMEQIAAGRLSRADVPLRDEASLVLYLVSPDYALRAGAVPTSSASTASGSKAQGCHVFFSSAVQAGENRYRTVGTSRAVALASTAPTLEQARVQVVRVRRHGARARVAPRRRAEEPTSRGWPDSSGAGSRRLARCSPTAG